MLDFFIENNIKTVLKNQIRSTKIFLNFKNIERILILFDYNSWIDVKFIVDDLIRNGKDVILWTIKPIHLFNNIEQAVIDRYSMRILDTKKDLKRTRTFRSEIIADFNALNYDTLIDLSFEQNLLMLYLKVSTRGKFSIGLQESPYRIYNFILLKEDDKNLFETYEQMKFYLSKNI